MLCFSLAAFRILSSSLTFATFIIICLGIGLFGSNLFGALYASCVLISVSWSFGKFSATISSNIFWIPFSVSSPPGIPLMCRLACYILSHRSLILLSCFSFVFLSAVLIGWFPLFYLPSHWFILLYYSFCSLVFLTQFLSLQMNFIIFIGSSLYFLVPF